MITKLYLKSRSKLYYIFSVYFYYSLYIFKNLYFLNLFIHVIFRMPELIGRPSKIEKRRTLKVEGFDDEEYYAIVSCYHRSPDNNTSVICLDRTGP